MSSKSVFQGPRVSTKCQVRVSYKSVKLERPTKVSSKSGPQECRASVSSQACPTRLSSKRVLQSVK